jgi:alkaline phosphatase
VASYRENGTSFEAVLSDIEADFGLVTPENASHTPYENLVMTDYEVNLLKDAYTLSMIPKDQRDLSDTDYLTYGGYEPLSMAVTHLINNKSGIGWTSYSHTGLPTAVFARGVGATLFSGAYDNTDIFVKLKSLTNVQ